MKVIVTGGAGYIGSHTILEIIETTDWEVISIDSFINSSADTYNRIEEISGKTIEHYQIDLTDLDALKKCISSIKNIDGIIHFAALKAVGESVEQPLLYFKNNISGLLNVLECVNEFKIPNFIFSSSCSIYGNVNKLPVDEFTPIKKCESPYAVTKAMGEEILTHFFPTTKSNLIALRYFNPVGAHKSGLIGENPINKPNNLFPVITQTAVGIIKQMRVFGNDYNTRDGSCIRDYIHVSDIAQAHILALKYSDQHKSTNFLDFFNLGSGEGVSVLEAITTFEKKIGIKLNYKIADRRSGDVEAIYSESSKAKNTLGWVPKKTLADMITSAYKWQLLLENEKNG